MKTKIYSLFAIITFSVTAWSQGISISEAGEQADESAILDIQSTEKGFLPPRMTTTQRDAIANPANGLIIYNTIDDCIQVNNGSPATPNWVCLGAGATANSVITTSAVVPTYNGTENIIVYTGATGNFTLPNPANYTNKLIHFINAGTGTANFITYIPNRTSCVILRGYVFFSDGTNWYNAGGF